MSKNHTAGTKKRTKQLAGLSGIILLYCFGALFFITTDPSRLPLPLLVAPFMWLFVTIFVTVLYMVTIRHVLSTRKRRILTAAIVAALPVMLLVFQSIHQLTIKDALLSVAIISIAMFYIQKADYIK